MTVEQGSHQAQREHVAALHSYLTRYELVTWTSGNVNTPLATIRVPIPDLEHPVRTPVHATIPRDTDPPLRPAR